MEVNNVSNHNPDYNTTTSKKEEPLTQELDKEAFLKILIAQLRNQDPLNPMDGDEFVAQMAQFSSLEQLTNLNESIKELKEQQQGMTAVNLLNREVTVKVDGETLRGEVTGVKMDADPKILIGDKPYKLSDLQEVHERGGENEQKD